MSFCNILICDREFTFEFPFRYVPPSPNRLDEDISEIMQKEGSDNDSQTGDEVKENAHPKRMRHEDGQVWDSSEMFLVETPVSASKKKFLVRS